MFLFRIRKHERGLRFRHGDFVEILCPGVYGAIGQRLSVERVQVVDTLETRFVHPLLDVLVQDAELRAELELVDLVDEQRALLWKDGRLEAILGPGRHAFWKQPHALEVEVFEVEGGRFEHPRLPAILAHRDAGCFLEAVHGEVGERALLFREGELIGTLDGGVAAFWKQVAGVSWSKVDLREQVADISGQEIMTADKVSVRVNLMVTYRVEDPVVAVTAVDDVTQTLYREAQLALRAAVGGRTLEALLTDKQAVGDEIREVIVARAAELGLRVRGVGLRDVILPGDMKSILNQVIEAQKQAEANLIRRREETAAARSQANTARLLADNPVLARMKELEALQEILSGAKATFVFGQGDLLGQVRELTRTSAEVDTS